MQINFIRKSEVNITSPRSGKYNGLREAFDKLESEEDALFITGLKPSTIYAALFPKRASVKKAIYDGEEGVVVTAPKQNTENASAE